MAKVIWSSDKWTFQARYDPLTGLEWKHLYFGNWEEKMEAGTRLVSNSGQDTRIVGVVYLKEGNIPMYKVWNSFYTREQLLENFKLVRDEAPSKTEKKPVETLELGDIVVGKTSKRKFEVVEITDDGRFALYKPSFGVKYNPLSEQTIKNDYVWPTRHRFYVEAGVLHCDPPLEIVEGVHKPLELSIRKWEVIAEYDGVVGNDGVHCALCVSCEVECTECVIGKAGYRNCSRTPYTRYGVHGNPQQVAREMVGFLKSLREPQFKVGDIVLYDYCNCGVMVCQVTKVHSNDDHDVRNVEGTEGYVGIPASALTPFVGHHFYVKHHTLRVVPALTGNEPDPLGLSIQKWEVIVAALERGAAVANCGGGSTCALCRSTARSDSDCEKCRIYALTGKHECRGTPYEWWARSRSLAAARAELAFLKELRDNA